MKATANSSHHSHQTIQWASVFVWKLPHFVVSQLLHSDLSLLICHPSVHSQSYRQKQGETSSNSRHKKLRHLHCCVNVTDFSFSTQTGDKGWIHQGVLSLLRVLMQDGQDECMKEEFYCKPAIFSFSRYTWSLSGELLLSISWNKKGWEKAASLCCSSPFIHFI